MFFMEKWSIATLMLGPLSLQSVNDKHIELWGVLVYFLYSVIFISEMGTVGGWAGAGRRS